MAVHSSPMSTFFLFLSLFPIIHAAASPLQTYIIQLRLPVNASFAGPGDLESWFISFLPNTTEPLGVSRIVHKYTSAMTGFAAKLTAEEVEEIAKKEGFLKAYPDRELRMFTTHTPTFLGLRPGNGFWNGTSFGKGVIIGMMDSGATPDHPSFNDQDMPPPPRKWKGKCEYGKTHCNNKIIGGRSFDLSSEPYDQQGHGTHTASTAAGNFVSNAEVLGNGKGTAVGMAPHAHLAIYRVCGVMGCMSSALLAGLDAAIADGVDVMSISLGGDVHEYDRDIIAIGAFAAAEKGIFVSCAAGNSGPVLSTLSNEAPWVLTVGASTIDRKISVTVKLGDGQQFEGESVFQPNNFTTKMLPLVYPPTRYGGGNCQQYSFYDVDVKGKVVVCERAAGSSRVELGENVKHAGGAAMILLNMETDGDTTLAEAHVLPASNVNYVDGSKIVSYVNSTAKPTASIIFKGTVLGKSSAPTVASFSSRGPSIVSPFILKPDVIGPGVSVIASWPFDLGSGFPDPTGMTFNFLSGTSMSTPHLSGIAALVKSVHPDWTPAAIKSAIMTTSETVDNDGEHIKDEHRKPASLFMIGAGHVNPEKAADPGLVYDVNVTEYIGYLCGLGYTDEKIEIITKHRVSCNIIKKIDESQLNYPSITVAIAGGGATVSRTVTNVGEANEEFSAKVEMPKGVAVSVVPEKLRFGSVNEKKRFTVTFKWAGAAMKGAEGHLSWVSDKHVVRSPIVIQKKPVGILN